jgi:cell division protein FtsI (penicillin-binding protein 3)
MNNNSHLVRLRIVGLFFCLLLIALIYRVIDLAVFHRAFLKDQGDARSLRVQLIPAHRGMITDRYGTPVAVSTPVESLWVNPKTFTLSHAQWRLLSKQLSLSPHFLISRIHSLKNREFAYLKRQLPPNIADKLRTLNISGLNFTSEFKRYYPEGESMAQLLGFTNIDDNGIEGLELAYQEWLKGTPGKKTVIKDRMGRIIDSVGPTIPPKSGHLLPLSIDRRIQYLAYHELTEALANYSAKFGSVVVLDIKSGEILAAANAPSFNPNARGQYDRMFYRNKAITDTFEPGSVIKPFSIASALESGLVMPDTIIDTRPGRLLVQGKLVRDIHNYGVLDVTGVLRHSSNVGVTKMILLSPPEQLITLLKKVGFSERTESGYPGEAYGDMISVKEAKPFVLSTLSFGYGISVTALQLAKAYMVFANDGRIKPVTLIHQGKVNIEGEPVISQKTAHQVMMMMEDVMNNGTGLSAKVAGYRVAGKTGTARIAGDRGYDRNKHIGSFVGIAPVTDPRLVVVVVIHEPTNGYYGAAVAAPLFSKVMGGALRILDIKPDQR